MIVVILGFVYCILHVCGGDPIRLSCLGCIGRYSPRVWRWSHGIDSWLNEAWVFSTCVEVILLTTPSLTLKSGILHVCGGDPVKHFAIHITKTYSPRVWRWSFTVEIFILHPSVFSTCVEVIPKAVKFNNAGNGYSPRVWRWSQFSATGTSSNCVFSTCVEVILPLLWY